MSATSRTTKKKRTIVVGSAVLGGLLLTGAGYAAMPVVADTLSTESVATINAEVAGQRDVSITDPVEFTVTDGAFTRVTVTGPDGTEVDGRMNDTRTSWAADDEQLEFDSTYRYSLSAKDHRDREVRSSGTFATVSPSSLIGVEADLAEGVEYGVGMPITLTFDQPIANQAAIEKRLEVTTDSAKPVEGAWSWQSDTTVVYRPRSFWPGNSEVTVTAELRGVAAGGGAYLDEDIDLDLSIADSLILEADCSTHQMTVEQDGKVVDEMPISCGNSANETRSGTKLVMSKEDLVIMDSATVGIPEGDPGYYRLEVEDAMRISWSGEYLHSAPWSVGSQGFSNVSHGCINLSPENAAWLMANATVGDPITVTGTSRATEPGNGITVWDISWQDWKSGSALA